MSVKYVQKAARWGQQASSSVWAAGAQLPSRESCQGAETEHPSLSHPWDAVFGLLPTGAIFGTPQRCILQKHFPFLLLTALTKEYSLQIIRWFWIYLPALAECHQTFLLCPWSSYLYHVQVWSGIPFRFSVANPGYILFLSSFFWIMTSRQSTHRNNRELAGWTCPIYTWSMCLIFVQVHWAACWELLREVSTSTTRVDGTLLPAGWRALVCIYLFKIKIILGVPGSRCGLHYYMAFLPCACSSLQDWSGRWSTSSPSFVLQEYLVGPSVHRHSLHWQVLRKLYNTKSHPGGHISESGHLCCVLLPQLGGKRLPFPSVEELDVILSPAEHQQRSSGKLDWICCFDFPWPRST